jgi:hypothetical protein
MTKMADKEVICSNCGENPNDRIYDCYECSNEICDNCTNICANCDENFCDGCYRDHKKACT